MYDLMTAEDCIIHQIITYAIRHRRMTKSYDHCILIDWPDLSHYHDIID